MQTHSEKIAQFYCSFKKIVIEKWLYFKRVSTLYHFKKRYSTFFFRRAANLRKYLEIQQNVGKTNWKFAQFAWSQHLWLSSTVSLKIRKISIMKNVARFCFFKQISFLKSHWCFWLRSKTAYELLTSIFFQISPM